MNASPTDWDGVARAKLTRVLGERAGSEMMTEILRFMGADALHSPADLRRFAEVLDHKGGFARAVAGLLSLHVAIHERDSMLPAGPR